MTRKKLLLIAGPLILILIMVSVFLVVQKRQATVTPVVNLSSQPIQEPTLLSYKDTAGFEFQYPEGLTIKDVSGDDDTVYSSLETSSAKASGKMVIKITDTSFASVDSWLKSKEATGAGTSREANLAGMAGKQIQFDNPRRLVTIVISEGIMYFFESPLEETNFWNKVHNDIVTSFALGQEEQAGGTTDDTVYEEEEVIE